MTTRKLQLCKPPPKPKPIDISSIKPDIPDKSAVVICAAKFFAEEDPAIDKLNRGHFKAAENRQVAMLAARKAILLDEFYDIASKLNQINSQQLALAAVVLGEPE